MGQSATVDETALSHARLEGQVEALKAQLELMREQLTDTRQQRDAW